MEFLRLTRDPLSSLFQAINETKKIKKESVSRKLKQTLFFVTEESSSKKTHKPKFENL